MRSMSRSQRPKSMIFPLGSEDILRTSDGRDEPIRSKSRQETSGKELLNDSNEDDEINRQMSSLQNMLTKKDQSIYKLTREMNEVRADKDQLEKLFEGSQAENQKCVQQINDLKEHVKLLETMMNRLNGPGWREDFSIPPTPGPRSSISLTTPIPDLSDVSVRKRHSVFGNAAFGQRMPHLVEMNPVDDDREEVVDSMRRYARQDDYRTLENAGADDEVDRQGIDQQRTGLSILDDGSLSTPKDEVLQKVEVDTSPSPRLRSQNLDLEPIISALSTLHATAHAQSAELLHKITEAETARALERERYQEDRRQSALSNLKDIRTSIQRDWEEMQSRDAEREQHLKTMMEMAMLKLDKLQCSEDEVSDAAVDPEPTDG